MEGIGIIEDVRFRKMKGVSVPLTPRYLLKCLEGVLGRLENMIKGREYVGVADLPEGFHFAEEKVLGLLDVLRGMRLNDEMMRIVLDYERRYDALSAKILPVSR